MDDLNIDKINHAFMAFREAAGLDDDERLRSLMNALADSGQAGEGGAYENLFALLADLLQAHNRRAYSANDNFLIGDAQAQDIQAGLNEAEHGEFASEAEVAAVFNRYGLDTQKGMASLRADFRRQGKGGSTQALLRERITDRAKE